MHTTLGAVRQRFMANLHNPQVRRYVGYLMLGKVLGIALLLASITWFMPVRAFAQATGQADQTTRINPINTMWTLIAAFLVFRMQVGFVTLEAGFARSREAVNILVEGIADTFICGMTFWSWGFAFMFATGTPWIGTTGFFLQGLPETYGATGVPLLAGSAIRTGTQCRKAPPPNQSTSVESAVA